MPFEFTFLLLRNTVCDNFAINCEKFPFFSKFRINLFREKKKERDSEPRIWEGIEILASEGNEEVILKGRVCYSYFKRHLINVICFVLSWLRYTGYNPKYEYNSTCDEPWTGRRRKKGCVLHESQRTPDTHLYPWFSYSYFWISYCWIPTSSWFKQSFQSAILAGH